MIVHVSVRLSAGGRNVLALGKLDTGADITVLPVEMFHDLRASPAGEAQIWCAQDVEPEVYPTYFVEVSVDAVHFFYLEVIGRKRPNALIGLDLLNEYVLTANGPKQVFDLILPM